MIFGRSREASSPLEDTDISEQLEGASVPMLHALMGDTEPGKRADAACALGDRLRTGDLESLPPEIIDCLARLLDDSAVMVRFEAAVTLAEAHDDRATPLLLGAMRSRSVRLDAIRALGTLGDQSAIDPLRLFMDRWLLPWADRLQAAAALCALHDSNGAAYLESKLGSKRRAERAAAIHFIGESRHPRGRVLLQEILGNRKDPMRDVAARALGLLGDVGARPILEAARQSADAELAADIEAALTKLT